MSEFIKEPFIHRNFQNIETKDIANFESLIQNRISVILGEPASGKTYQLKHYQQQKTNILYQELININIDEINIDKKDTIFLDSIDEALSSYDNFKKLQDKLTKYIQRCKNKNSKIKFVITCRQLEWNEYFSDNLKSIFDTLKVYQILDLEKKQINILLKNKQINSEEFWKFASSNYLIFLLKNILIILKIIDKYSEYRTKTISYIDIYIDIIKEHLSVKGEDRENQYADKSLSEYFSITSSLATYMILNRKTTISINNLMMLSDDLYEIDNRGVKATELNVVLNSALFKKDKDKFSFFHKSIQEFLMAYFINKKNLSVEKIKDLFSFEMRFYEEFEEIIIYLTNLNRTLFDVFVNFDPFIFKRHPDLNKKQQEKLLQSMLDKLINNKSMAWGKWSNFDNTTIVKFNKLNNIAQIIENKLTSSNIDQAIFTYLIKVLENNYTKELENLIFEYLNQYENKENIVGKEEYDEISYRNNKLRKLIEYSFIDNFNFNCRLFEFLKQKQLLNTNKQKISLLNFETRLFESLYGIKYINRYENNKEANFKDTNYKFEKILILLNSIPSRQLEYIVPYLKSKDTLKWLNSLQIKQEKNNNHTACWCIYAVLKHNCSKDTIQKIFEFLNTHICYISNAEIDNMPFEFERISTNFWEVYFASNLENIFRINSLLEILNITLKDIKKATLQYSIEKHIKHYIKFRLNPDIDKFLMKNSMFERHMIKVRDEIKKQEEEYRRKSQYELLESETYQKVIEQKNNEDKICEESLKSLKTKNDFYNVFFCKKIYEEKNVNKLDEILNDTQKQEILLFIEDDFKKDQSYIEIKNNINANSFPIFPTVRYIYWFQQNNKQKIFEVVQSKEDCEKVFFHTFRYDKVKENFFISLASNYFDYFIDFIIKLIKLSLAQSQNKNIVCIGEMIEVIKEIQKFNKSDLIKIIDYFKSLDKDIYKSIKEEYKIEKILKILLLDEQSYDIFDKLVRHDTNKSSLYLKYLLKINYKKALDSYILEYQKKQTYIKFYKLKRFFGLTTEIKNINKYDKENICQAKIKLLKNLIIALKENKGFNAITDKYLILIINDYYEFFYEYERPTGSYSPDIYNSMFEFINSLFNYLSATSSHIEMLKELSQNNNLSLSDTAKYHLQQAYNNKNKDRNYSNAYYKKIFDNGSNVNQSDIEKWQKKWGELTMFKKIGLVGSLASIVGLLLYFVPSSSSTNNVNSQRLTIQNNNGNIIYNIDNSNNRLINNNVRIKTKINNLMQQITVNLKGKNKGKQKAINAKIFILGESKKINEKNISINEKNKECKNKASSATNSLNFNLNLMNTICNEVF